MSFASVFEKVRGRLIVSCQPVAGGPFDRPEVVADYVRATTDGGAAGFRIEGAANIRAAREVTDRPLIGLIKRPFGNNPAWITGTTDDVTAVIGAGADIVAIDATIGARPAPVDDLFAAAHALNRPVLADISTLTEAQAAAESGADAAATTLSLDCTDTSGRPCPDLALIRDAAATLSIPVVAEGNVRTPADAMAARKAGAWAVVVGSAITRPEFVTSWFAEALTEADQKHQAHRSQTGSK
ncbi:MAG: putative N-acetylmannosamine-6-phosphate 2-epimerase [Pseudomonadota bacterium]